MVSGPSEEDRSWTWAVAEEVEEEREEPNMLRLFLRSLFSTTSFSAMVTERSAEESGGARRVKEEVAMDRR